MPATLDQVAVDTLSDRVFVAIRDQLLRSSHDAGRFVREQDLAASLGVSRTPVREALVRLAHAGFLERVPRRGFRVPSVSVTQLLERYPIVAALEVLAAETSMPRLTRDDLAALRAINAEFLAASRRRDVEAGFASNNRFHHVLSARCGNATLCDVLDEMRAQVMRLELWSARQPAHAREAARQHEEIVRLVAAARFVEALALLRENRLQTYTAFQRELEGDRSVAGSASHARRRARATSA